MLVVNLDELQEAKNLIDLINNTPLNKIVWKRNNRPQITTAALIEEWRFTGLSNVYFAYNFFLNNT